jgi:hypothetical protein
MSLEFLDLLEGMRAEEATTSRLFNSAEGRGVRGLRRTDPRYQRSFAQAADLVEGVLTGRKQMYVLQEAMTTSDFPLLFGDVIDRAMLARYTEWDTTWDVIARRGTVRDFRTVKRNTLDGGEAVLGIVPQAAEYPEAALTEGQYTYSVAKYGRRLPFVWEDFVNDDLDALRDAPDRLAKAARMTEDRFVTSLIAASTGPNATFFASGNANLLTAGAGSALSVSSLSTAYGLLRKQKDKDGNPIYINGVTLVVPPALEVTANNIANATEIRVATGGGGTSAADQITATNWLGKVFTRIEVNPWLPILTTTGTIGDTAWYLFANPNTGRPAAEIGFLRGHETPELFMKSPNATRIGGGLIGAEDGDFDTDSINYKVRHVIGGTLMEPKAAVASFGQ